MVKVTIGRREDKARLMQTIVLGFCADPMARWASPDPAVYLDRRDEFFDAFGGAAFDHGTAFVADDGAAVATWLPPGVEPDNERMEKIMAEQTPDNRKQEMSELFAKMEAFRLHEPHWYLPLIAADPARQGQGLGTALMEAAIARIDEDGRPAYLDSSNSRNVPLYRRFGFEPIGQIKTASSPVQVPMIRRARR
ncbi:N-acetyltransferase [Sphingosinicella sp. CPCC 101087]|uniref:GNAT family N-acetyltransferase n=1 Tax=Sphingosinicella sp. CPCC 101087 TaxID=2497754 RepID=UPI00101C4F3E|nr:GNAT family N-acetyltransferase [Sphingosinicella sp. CPCC 101087]